VRKIRYDGAAVSFRCPGCGDVHRLPVSDGPGNWQWNGDVNRPTVTPSVLTRSGHYSSTWKQGDACWCNKDYLFTCYRCHLFVRDGRLEFLADSTHALAGQTVDMQEIAADEAL
jgi:hypothetical protein